MTPSKEVNDAVGEAGMRTKEPTAAEQLERKRTELGQAEKQLAQAEAAMDVDATISAKQRITVVKDFIVKLEAKAQGEVEAAARTAAEKRIVGISRAVGSVAASIEADEEKVFQCAEAYDAAVRQLNDRHRQLEGLAAESRALLDRFGIEGAKIPTVTAPNERERVVAAVRMIEAVPYATGYPRRPAFEECEHRLRPARRTYAEVSGTPGHDIIMQVGPKPFPQLTEKQQRAVEAAQGEATVGGDPMLAREAAAVLALPPGVSAKHADVHRR